MKFPSRFQVQLWGPKPCGRIAPRTKLDVFPDTSLIVLREVLTSLIHSQINVSKTFLATQWMGAWVLAPPLNATGKMCCVVCVSSTFCSVKMLGCKVYLIWAHLTWLLVCKTPSRTTKAPWKNRQSELEHGRYKLNLENFTVEAYQTRSCPLKAISTAKCVVRLNDNSNRSPNNEDNEEPWLHNTIKNNKWKIWRISLK